MSRNVHVELTHSSVGIPSREDGASEVGTPDSVAISREREFPNQGSLGMVESLRIDSHGTGVQEVDVLGVRSPDGFLYGKDAVDRMFRDVPAFRSGAVSDLPDVPRERETVALSSAQEHVAVGARDAGDGHLVHAYTVHHVSRVNAEYFQRPRSDAGPRSHPDVVSAETDALHLVVLGEALVQLRHGVDVDNIELRPLHPVAAQPQLAAVDVGGTHSSEGVHGNAARVANGIRALYRDYGHN